MSSHAFRARGSITIAAVAALTVLGVAGPAAAHVTANPRTAEQGSYSKVSFRVPNERDDAGTTKLQIDLPIDHPVASVSVRPTPGWKVKVDKSKLPTPIKTHGGELTEAVSRITWTGGKIEPGRFEEFDVSMGPLPADTDRMLFKTEQTYSNGEIVKWDQDPGTEGQEPEHPAPMLQLTPKAAGSAGGHDTAKPTANVAGSEKVSADDGTARTLGWLGLAAGLIGIVVGGLGLARARNRS
jgi:uncharacterized protein YcnI